MDTFIFWLKDCGDLFAHTSCFICGKSYSFMSGRLNKIAVIKVYFQNGRYFSKVLSGAIRLMSTHALVLKFLVLRLEEFEFIRLFVSATAFFQPVTSQ